MRIWLLGVTLCVSLGCASPAERGEVWCEHEDWWATPHALDLAQPAPLDLDLIGGADPREAKLVSAYVAALEAGAARNDGLLVHVSASLPGCNRDYYTQRSLEAPMWDSEAWSELQGATESAYRALVRAYEAPLLRDLEQGDPALWQRLLDLTRLGQRHTSEVAWRELGDSALAGERPRLGFQRAKRAQEELFQLIYLIENWGPRRVAPIFLRDSSFKQLLSGIRRVWGLAGLDPGALTRSLKDWRRRSLTRPPEPRESLESLSLGAERYRDRALDAALDATLAAEGARGE